MTDNEIIKALENYSLKTQALFEALKLIKSQKAEIEALKNSKSEAIKEFAERVKMEVNFILLYYKFDKIVPQLGYEVSAIIQKIEKEMTEGENG